MYPTFSRTSFLNIKVTGMCLILFSRSYRETWGRSKYGVSLISSLGPSAIQSNRDHLLMSSKHSADWSQCCQKFCWEGLTLIGVMLKAHLRPFWFPCGMAGGQPLLITSPRKAAQSGWLICHTPWALQRKQEWAPFSTASASPLEGQWTQQGHRNLSFVFLQQPGAGFTHILALELSIYERQGRLNGSHSVDTSCPHFPIFPTPVPLVGIFLE